MLRVVLCVFLLLWCANTVFGEGCIGRDQAPRSRDNKICSWYNRRTCCDFEDLGFNDDSSMSQADLDENSPCPVEQGCMDQLNLAACAICSPESDTIFGNGILRVCKPFAEDLYDACKNSEVLQAGNQCSRIENDYPDPESFVNGFMTNAKYVDDTGGNQGTLCLSGASASFTLSTALVLLFVLSVALL